MFSCSGQMSPGQSSSTVLTTYYLNEMRGRRRPGEKMAHFFATSGRSPTPLGEEGERGRLKKNQKFKRDKRGPFWVEKGGEERPPLVHPPLFGEGEATKMCEEFIIYHHTSLQIEDDYGRTWFVWRSLTVRKLLFSVSLSLSYYYNRAHKCLYIICTQHFFIVWRRPGAPCRRRRP